MPRKISIAETARGYIHIRQHDVPWRPSVRIDTQSNGEIASKRDGKGQRAGESDQQVQSVRAVEKRDEQGRGRTRELAGCRGRRGRGVQGGPGTMGPVCSLRVSVTARLYRLARNATPEEAHEHTHTHASRVRARADV